MTEFSPLIEEGWERSAGLKSAPSKSPKTYAWTPHLVGANGRSPLQMAVQRSICVSPAPLKKGDFDGILPPY